MFLRIVDLKYCVVFKCRVECFGYTYSFSDSFAYTLMNIKSYKILNIACCATQQDLVGHLFHI